MNNKNTGIIIIAMAIVMGIIVFLFNNAMTKIVNASCTHGSSCAMYGTIKTQTYVSLILILVIVAVGIAVMRIKENKAKMINKVPEKKIKKDYSLLDKDEKSVLKIVNENNNAMFQSDIAEKLGMSKVKLTRILDRLEGKNIVERKRRGMTNIVLAR